MRVAVEFGVIDYIADRKGPRLFCRGEIRILDSNGAVERVIPFNETERNYDRRDDLLHMRTSERCLISLTIFSSVSLASLGPRIAIGTPDH